MNMSYVASHFAPSRRRENLSWSHHAELSALCEADQDMWLDRCTADHLSVRSLREERRSTQRLELGPPGGPALPRGGRQATRSEVVCPHCGGHFVLAP